MNIIQAIISVFLALLGAALGIAYAALDNPIMAVLWALVGLVCSSNATFEFVKWAEGERP